MCVMVIVGTLDSPDPTFAGRCTPGFGDKANMACTRVKRRERCWICAFFGAEKRMLPGVY